MVARYIVYHHLYQKSSREHIGNIDDSLMSSSMASMMHQFYIEHCEHWWIFDFMILYQCFIHVFDVFYIETSDVPSTKHQWLFNESSIKHNNVTEISTLNTLMIINVCVEIINLSSILNQCCIVVSSSCRLFFWWKHIESSILPMCSRLGKDIVVEKGRHIGLKIDKFKKNQLDQPLHLQTK